MKATILSKILFLFLFCVLLNSCTADDAPTQNTPPVSADGGPVIPPGPKP